MKMHTEQRSISPSGFDAKPARDRSDEPTLWGLQIAEIHEAFWASHGVACVIRGSCVAPRKGADLYLLLEAGQGVHFDLRRIAESLLWNQAHITRLRILEPEASQYSERVILNSAGTVERIERRYGADRIAGQVLLGTRLEDAESWAQATTATAAFIEMRRRGHLRVDATECVGARFDLSDLEGKQALLDCLVGSWAHPDRVIRGIEAIAHGVFGPTGSAVFSQDRFIAPVWIGSHAEGIGATDIDRGLDTQPKRSVLAIGPVAIWDTVAREPADVIPIDELFAADTPNRVESTKEPAGYYAPLKRAMDIVGSLLALLISAPILFLCACAVVIDDGFPIFFGHKRQTKGGKSFRCWKFRTMRRNAETLVAELRKQNLCDGPQVNIKDDPRVTRVGKVLRKLQLDEFPQFWNVFIGDMSIVGPRPSPENENQFCPAWREVRLSVRPGITGYWQVMRTREQGRDFQEWIQYDIAYVERMGLLFDLWICLRTMINLAGRK